MKLGDFSEQRALSTVIREARREGTPKPDWDSLEERLLANTRVAALPRTTKQRRPWLVVLAPIAAVAAGFALFAKRPSPGPVAAPVSPSQMVVDGDLLQPQKVLIATDGPLRVAHRGRAEWTLEPHGRATLLERSGVVHILLDQGALSADVVPGQEPERFVVQARGLRVAVHGTRFRVELHENRSSLQVDEGVVSVSSIAQSGSKPLLFRAPAREEFTLTGNVLRSTAPPAPRGRPKSTTHVSRTPAAKALPGATAPAPMAASPLTIGEVEMGVTSIVEAVSDCFHSHTEASSDMKISARTSVTLEVAQDGSISSVSFDPPLSPSVQVCSEERVQAVQFAPSSDGAHVTRWLELDR